MKRILLAGLVLFFLINSIDATFESRWDYKPIGSITKIYAGDIDNDKNIEVLVSTDDGDFYVLTYNGKLKWMYNTKKDEDKVINDFYLSGDRIILGSNDVYCLGTNSLEKWKFKLEGNANAVFAKDLEGDGQEEVIVGSSINKVYVLVNNEKIKWEYKTEEPIRTVSAEDIDNDGYAEVIAGSWIYDPDIRENSGKVYVLDKDGKLKWSYDVPVQSLSVSDLDNDGLFEIVVGSRNNGLYLLDRNGKLKWKFDTDKMVTKVYTDSLNGDKFKEIVFGSSPYLYVLDKDGKEIWKQKLTSSVYDIFVTDLKNDGVKEVIVGSNVFTYIFDEKGNLEDKWKRETEDAETVGVYAADLYKKGIKNVILGYNWLFTYLDKSNKEGKVEAFDITGGGKTGTTMGEKEKGKGEIIPEGGAASSDEKSEAKETKGEGFPVLYVLLGIIVALCVIFVVYKQVRKVKKN